MYHLIYQIPSTQGLQDDLRRIRTDFNNCYYHRCFPINDSVCLGVSSLVFGLKYHLIYQPISTQRNCKMRGLNEISKMNDKAIKDHEAYQRYRLEVRMPNDLAIPMIILLGTSIVCGIISIIMQLT